LNKQQPRHQGALCLCLKVLTPKTTTIQ